MKDSNDNISSELTNSMYKSSPKRSVHSDQAYVRFSDSKTKEKDSEPKTVANLGSALDRKRSLSEIFLRTTSAKYVHKIPLYLITCLDKFPIASCNVWRNHVF